MVEWPLILLILVAVALGAVAAYLAWRAQEDRRKRFGALAERLGLRYSTGASFDRGLRHFDAMRPGTSPRIRDEIAGEFQGRQVRCFEFRYTVQQGKSSATHKRAVALANVPASWPHLRIVPEHLGLKILDALGADDIDFESQDFSDRFWVTSADRKFAYDVIDARMMEYLMTARFDRWELRDGLLCAWREAPFKPEEVEATLAALATFLDRVPRHVWPQGARAA